ncbi:MAG: EAL domain-containing protein, partial [Paracoccaceae bacterium]|nr:EAL domain-containing protein [Paracoccaceae bacterium]
FLEAAEIAADDARQNGPSGIRAFSAELQRLRTDRTELRADLQTALDQGQIVPFFQPQVATLSGEITGFEALARWQHPKRGLIPPAEFIPLIEQAGLSERLGEVILNQSLTALASWDAAGLRVPTIAVNFSHEQLRVPRLADVLKWEMDRFDLTPERLTVEILETVVAETDNDVIVHNIAALSRLGCGLDLDDFGTGHASIANIRRFSVRRIKIDRSFITHVDADIGQQRMVSAILSMATQLGLETLAEGVETVEEHAMLAQLECGHIQGFGIAPPMDFDASTTWIRHYRGKLTSAPRIGRHAV